MFEELIAFIRQLYGQPTGKIPLHAPTFTARDKELVLDAIDSTFVSSVGRYVDRFELMLAEFTGAKRAVASVNGTTALQVALQLAGVGSSDEVITQPLTFVATANAVSLLGAVPVFVDVDKDTMGMSPAALDAFLSEHAVCKGTGAYNRHTGRRIAAIVPMHTYGHPCRIEKIVQTADAWSIPVVEDAAEAIGSTINGKHCGCFGKLGILSFNGNKTITCGGGGAILTNDYQLADHAKHITTTAKIPHPWEFDHDEVAYNFRLPNLNAALACAQMESLPGILQEKQEIAAAYKTFFNSHDWGRFMMEPENTQSNYWLCSVALADRASRDAFLEQTNSAGVMTRPAWKLMPHLAMYADCQTGPLENAQGLSDRIVNLPSGIRTHG